MGWDDNGLPTERLVEKRLGITPENVGAKAFIDAILQTSKELGAWVTTPVIEVSR
jgi:valyl-tRNA synthetase